jgi:hypothetical protein
MSEGPLTYEDLRKRWNCSKRQVNRICARIGLKPLDLGHRTKRFRPADVDRAEAAAAGERHGRRYQ